MPDRQVETLLRQRGELVGELHLDPHFRVGLQEGRDARDDLLAAQRHRRRYPQQAARLAGKIAHAGKTALDVREGVARGVRELLAGFRQPDAACGPLHQRHPGAALQLRDPLAHRPLAHAQAHGRGRVAAELTQHDQRVQVRPVGLFIFVFHRGIVYFAKQ